MASQKDKVKRQKSLITQYFNSKANNARNAERIKVGAKELWVLVNNFCTPYLFLSLRCLCPQIIIYLGTSKISLPCDPGSDIPNYDLLSGGSCTVYLAKRELIFQLHIFLKARGMQVHISSSLTGQSLPIFKTSMF